MWKSFKSCLLNQYSTNLIKHGVYNTLPLCLVLSTLKHVLFQVARPRGRGVVVVSRNVKMKRNKMLIISLKIYSKNSYNCLLIMSIIETFHNNDNTKVVNIEYKNV